MVRARQKSGSGGIHELCNLGEERPRQLGPVHLEDGHHEIAVRREPYERGPKPRASPLGRAAWHVYARGVGACQSLALKLVSVVSERLYQSLHKLACLRWMWRLCRSQYIWEGE